MRITSIYHTLSKAFIVLPFFFVIKYRLTIYRTVSHQKYLVLKCHLYDTLRLFYKSVFILEGADLFEQPISTAKIPEPLACSNRVQLAVIGKLYFSSATQVIHDLLKCYLVHTDTLRITEQKAKPAWPNIGKTVNFNSNMASREVLIPNPQPSFFANHPADPGGFYEWSQIPPNTSVGILNTKNITPATAIMVREICSLSARLSS